MISRSSTFASISATSVEIPRLLCAISSPVLTMRIPELSPSISPVKKEVRFVTRYCNTSRYGGSGTGPYQFREQEIQGGRTQHVVKQDITWPRNDRSRAQREGDSQAATQPEVSLDVLGAGCVFGTCSCCEFPRFWSQHIPSDLGWIVLRCCCVLIFDSVVGAVSFVLASGQELMVGTDRHGRYGMRLVTGMLGCSRCAGASLEGSSQAK